MPSLYTSWPTPWHLRGPGEVKLQDSFASMLAQAEAVEDEADDLKKATNFSLLDWNEIRRKQFDLKRDSFVLFY